MATVIFAYDHGRDPMNPADLADRIASQFSLSTPPQVDITPTEIRVTHPQASEAQRAAVQAIINAYVLDPVRTSYPEGVLGTLMAKAQRALDANATFLAIGSPTAAQVRDQTILLTKEVDALIKVALGLATDTTGT